MLSLIKLCIIFQLVYILQTSFYLLLLTYYAGEQRTGGKE